MNFHSIRSGLKAAAAILIFAGLNLGCESIPTLVGAPEADGEVAATATADTPMIAPSSASQSYSNLDSAIAGVRSAPTVSNALTAYSAGLALDPENIPLQEAYVRRLVELKAPQLAEPAARRLVGVSLDSSLAWAVIAFGEARHGNMIDAVTDISLAARKLPDDSFVQQTTGELLAWYDNTPAAHPQLPPGVSQGLTAARQGLAQKSAYLQAYAKADAFYKNPPRPQPLPVPGGADGGAPEPFGTTNPIYTVPQTDLAPLPPTIYSGTEYPAEPAYVPSYLPSYAYPSYGYDYAYPGYGLGFCGPLFLGGDWGWCGGGDWHNHWDNWRHHGNGLGYAHGIGGGSFAHSYGSSQSLHGGHYPGGTNYYRSNSVSRGNFQHALPQSSAGRSSIRGFSSAQRYSSPRRSSGSPGRSYGSSRGSSPRGSGGGHHR